MKKNHWPASILKEVITFLSRQHPGGIRVAAVGEKLGMTPQAVSAILLKDDTSLSWAENLAQKYDHQLRFEFTLPVCIQDQGDSNAAVRYPNAGNLIGIACYALSRGFTINTLARYLNLNYRVVERALKTGNIQLSTMYLILNRLDIKVKWVWEPLPQLHQ